MSADLSEHLAGWDGVQNALGDVRAVHGEFRHFFADVFNQLSTMLTDLTGRRSQWESQQQRGERGLAERAAELDRDRAAVAAQQQRLEEEARTAAEGNDTLGRLLEDARQEGKGIRDSQQQFQADVVRLADALENDQLGAVLEEIRQQRAELRGVQEASQQQAGQLATVSAQLTDAQRELTEAQNEIAERWKQLQPRQCDGVETQSNDELEQRFRRLQQHQASLEQERTVLESELEAVRNRAAEMTELLAEQKQQAAAQRAEWAGELKRMRRLLEGISGHLADGGLPAAAHESDCRQPSAADVEATSTPLDEDPILDSVAAQFEMLQKDLAKRRAAKSEQRGTT
jgi:chromosome segregation ATPase